MQMDLPLVILKALEQKVICHHHFASLSPWVKWIAIRVLLLNRQDNQEGEERRNNSSIRLELP
jgi:hypothetical protein